MAFPGLVQRFSRNSSQIVIVDQYSGFSVENDLYDGAHPNPAGELKIARNWYSVLELFLVQ
jgi:acyl-CoA thioesterase I